MKDNNALRTIFILVAIALTVWFAWYIREILFLFIMAIVIAMMVRPFVNKMNRLTLFKKPMPRGVSAFSGILLVFVVIVGISSLFIPLIATEVATIRKINPAELSESIAEPVQNLNAYLESHNIRFSQDMGNLAFLKKEALAIFDPSKISSLFGNVISGVGNVFFAFSVILFVLFFLLKEDNLVQNVVLKIAPDDTHQSIGEFSTQVAEKMGDYFTGIVVETALFGAGVSIGLFALGIENALVIGILAGILNVIPYLGPIIGAFFGMLIAATTHLDLSSADFFLLIGSVGLVFIVMQIIDNTFMQPIIYSKSVNAHPLEIFLVLMVAGQVGGVIGMIFGVPAYTTIRIGVKAIIKFIQREKALTEEQELVN